MRERKEGKKEKACVCGASIENLKKVPNDVFYGWRARKRVFHLATGEQISGSFVLESVRVRACVESVCVWEREMR